LVVDFVKVNMTMRIASTGKKEEQKPRGGGGKSFAKDLVDV
jgi:hypothetical protein